MEKSSVKDDIFRACRLGDLFLLNQTLSHPEANINQIDPELGWTPLYHTVICGHFEVAQFLLDKGASPNIPSKIGETPLHQAADNSKFRMAKLLLEYNADPNNQQHDGDTPLHHAASKGDLKLTSLLLSYKANPNITNYVFGRAALHYSVEYGHEKIVKILIKHGASIEIKDRIGKTPLDLAPNNDLKKILTHKISAENSSEKSTRTSPLCMPSLDPIDTIPSIPMQSFENISLSPHSSRSNSGYSTPSNELKFLDLKNRKRLTINSRHNSTQTQPDLNRSLSSVLEPESEKLVNETMVEKQREVSFGGENKPQMYNWLVMTKLDELFDVLLNAGYDDIKQMCEQMRSSMPLNDEILKEIGVKKPGLRKRLLAALDEDALPKPFSLNSKRRQKWRCCSVATPTSEGVSFPTLRNWLLTLGLDMLLPLFENSGYDDLEHLLALMNSRWPITDEILKNEIKISKPGHRHRILSKLKDDSNGVRTMKRNYGGFSNRSRKEDIIVEAEANSTACEICKLM
ncbi:unnamed protein product [Blepharisma stoltei]|uniref:SAM domain-containing protein n=1 Tax=Blepharisma stoltei TaxID=1481888 RepID=A0AAU9JP53_9CILI|nr:unnamed protein product [Blepharisma stoltei]